MIRSTIPKSIEKSKISSFENKKNIENHRKTAIHLDAATKHHLEAAKHHSDGNHEKAALSSIAAQRELNLANENQKDL